VLRSDTDASPFGLSLKSVANRIIFREPPFCVDSLVILIVELDVGQLEQHDL
jgi:hypothetical protein